MGCMEDFIRAYKTLSDTTIHLMKKVPEGKEDFKPATGDFMTTGQLLHHLGDTQRFFRLILEGGFRELDKNFLEYMSNHPSSSTEKAIEYYKSEYGKVIELLNLMDEEEFQNISRYFWTVDDEPMPFIAFNIIEHNACHKYQLFMYLKMMGLPNINSFALAGEDDKLVEEIIKFFEMAHKAYDEKQTANI
ncbi:MAG: DinB family protein [Firmicutes bacterium]|nr:DinB family protein [Bacillota bacterium]